MMGPMQESTANPFRVTRAADFTDLQIDSYWVDLAAEGGFQEAIKPRLDMPMLILGGKGSGKTHIMRYLSFPLQRIRHSADVVSEIAAEGYLGIYMRCSGLNATRFRGKGQSDDVWATVFAYYMELWLAQLAVDTCFNAIRGSASVNETAIAGEIAELFDDPEEDFPTSLQGLSAHLRELLKRLDVAINNCAIDGALHVSIRATSGKLVFGIPDVFVKHVAEIKDCLFVYLIDEFENLAAEQQKLVNTLLRERQGPCSFKVGARLFGVRTYSTFCADEDNKEGSEYELLPLDELSRQNEERYAVFARRLVVRRLVRGGVLSTAPESDDEMRGFLEQSLEGDPTQGLAQEATRFVAPKYEGRDRPYFGRLRRMMELGLRSDAAHGISSAEDIDAVLDRLACADFPLLEKLNCFMLYQQWSSRRNLPEAAASISRDCQSYVNDRDARKVRLMGRGPVSAGRVSQVISGHAACAPVPRSHVRWLGEPPPRRSDRVSSGGESGPPGAPGPSAASPDRCPTPSTRRAVAALVVRMAVEHPQWGDTRIRGALSNLGHEIARTTVKRILHDHGIDPAPERSRRMPGKTFLQAPWEGPRPAICSPSRCSRWPGSSGTWSSS